MGNLNNTNNAMQSPIPETDWGSVIKWVTSIIGGVIALWKITDKYFEDREKQRKKYISDIVQETLASGLSEVKSDIRQLQAHREADRTYFEGKFTQILMEIRK